MASHSECSWSFRSPWPRSNVQRCEQAHLAAAAGAPTFELLAQVCQLKQENPSEADKVSRSNDRLAGGGVAAQRTHGQFRFEEPPGLLSAHTKRCHFGVRTEAQRSKMVDPVYAHVPT